MSLSAIVRAASLGAAAMYFLDPERGRRRRAVAQDKARSMMRRSERFLDAAKRDAQNRVQGLQVRASRMRQAPEWPPAVRLAAIAGGGALALYGLTRSGVTRPVWSVAGLALVARGATNAPLAQLAEIARQAGGSPTGTTPRVSESASQDETDDWTRAAPMGPPTMQPGASS
jgi:hypothetical protein